MKSLRLTDSPIRTYTKSGIRAAVAVLTCFLLQAGGLYAQFTSAIQGHIADPSGASVSKA